MLLITCGQTSNGKGVTAVKAIQQRRCLSRVSGRRMKIRGLLDVSSWQERQIY